jgi:hypothetical protein
MPSDAESSSDDDAKTERYRDPTPPGDDFVPDEQAAMYRVNRLPRHEATATGLRLPIVTREEAKAAQMEEGSESGEEQPDVQDVPAPKERPKKKSKKQRIPTGNQLSVWVFRYFGDQQGASIIDFDLLVREARIKLKSDITHFKQINSLVEDRDRCIEFHTTRRILRSKMMGFLKDVFGIKSITQVLSQEDQDLLRDKRNEAKIKGEEVHEINMATMTTKRIVQLEKANKVLETLPSRVERLEELVDLMRKRIKTLERNPQAPAGQQ